jgi:hypothetical protein
MLTTRQLLYHQEVGGQTRLDGGGGGGGGQWQKKRHIRADGSTDCFGLSRSYAGEGSALKFSAKDDILYVFEVETSEPFVRRGRFYLIIIYIFIHIIYIIYCIYEFLWFSWKFFCDLPWRSVAGCVTKEKNVSIATDLLGGGGREDGLFCWLSALYLATHAPTLP